jgi:hypothetical protein
MGNSYQELQRQITELNIAAEKLKQSGEQFRLLVEGVQDYAMGVRQICG